jgi:hypothetical protein
MGHHHVNALVSKPGGHRALDYKLAEFDRIHTQYSSIKKELHLFINKDQTRSWQFGK